MSDHETNKIYRYLYHDLKEFSKLAQESDTEKTKKKEKMGKMQKSVTDQILKIKDHVSVDLFEKLSTLLENCVFSWHGLNSEEPIDKQAREKAVGRVKQMLEDLDTPIRFNPAEYENEKAVYKKALDLVHKMFELAKLPDEQKAKHVKEIEELNSEYVTAISKLQIHIHPSFYDEMVEARNACAYSFNNPEDMSERYVKHRSEQTELAIRLVPKLPKKLPEKYIRHSDK